MNCAIEIKKPEIYQILNQQKYLNTKEKKYLYLQIKTNFKTLLPLYIQKEITQLQHQKAQKKITEYLKK